MSRTRQANRWEIDFLIRQGYRVYAFEKDVSNSLFTRMADVIRNRYKLDIFFDNTMNLVIIKNKKPEEIEQTKSVI